MCLYIQFTSLYIYTYIRVYIYIYILYSFIFLWQSETTIVLRITSFICAYLACAPYCTRATWVVQRALYLTSRLLPLATGRLANGRKFRTWHECTIVAYSDAVSTCPMHTARFSLWIWWLTLFIQIIDRLYVLSKLNENSKLSAQVARDRRMLHSVVKDPSSLFFGVFYFRTCTSKRRVLSTRAPFWLAYSVWILALVFASTYSHFDMFSLAIYI